MQEEDPKPTENGEDTPTDPLSTGGSGEEDLVPGDEGDPSGGGGSGGDEGDPSGGPGSGGVK